MSAFEPDPTKKRKRGRPRKHALQEADPVANHPVGRPDPGSGQRTTSEVWRATNNGRPVVTHELENIRLFEVYNLQQATNGPIYLLLTQGQPVFLQRLTEMEAGE